MKPLPNLASYSALAWPALLFLPALLDFQWLQATPFHRALECYAASISGMAHSCPLSSSLRGSMGNRHRIFPTAVQQLELLVLPIPFPPLLT